MPTQPATPTKVIINCETGAQEVVPLTAEEIADLEAVRANSEAERIAREEAEAARAALKASAKAKLIAGQPLTAEEADTLVI